MSTARDDQSATPGSKASARKAPAKAAISADVSPFLASAERKPAFASSDGCSDASASAAPLISSAVRSRPAPSEIVSD
jgi:hypothetical protein